MSSFEGDTIVANQEYTCDALRAVAWTEFTSLSKMTPTSDLTATSSPTRKTWSVGTLTYTSAGLVTLFFWLLWGDFAWATRDRSVAPIAQWYLTHLGIPSFLYGILTGSFPALVTLVLSPIISVKSDRHRGSHGRRIPFLIVTTPAAALGIIGLAFTPFISREVHALVPHTDPLTLSVVCFGMFWAAFEVAAVASQAVMGGLINDVVPRPLLGRFYGLFRAVSLLDGAIFNYYIIGKVPEHFTFVLCAIGVFYGCAFMWMCFKVREGDYPPPPPSPVIVAANAGGFRRFFAEVGAYCRECFTRPYYVAIFTMLMLGVVSINIVNTFAIPFARSLDVSMETYGRCLALTFIVSLCISYPLGWLVDIVHPLRVLMASMAGYAGIALFGGFYATTPSLFVIALVAHGIVSGCFYTSMGPIAQMLLPRSRFAQFASAATMFVALGNMAAAPTVGRLLDITGKYYPLVFFGASLLALLGVACAVCVHREFRRLGGPANYVAPE